MGSGSFLITCIPPARLVSVPHPKRPGYVPDAQSQAVINNAVSAATSKHLQLVTMACDDALAHRVATMSLALNSSIHVTTNPIERSCDRRLCCFEAVPAYPSWQPHASDLPADM